MRLTDTHCHLDHAYLKNDYEQVVERARGGVALGQSIAAIHKYTDGSCFDRTV